MKIKLTLLLLFCFFSAFIHAEKLGNLSPEQLIAMQQSPEAPLIIDIRTEKEWNTTGIIPNSHKLQFFSASGQYDATQWLSDLDQLKTSSEQTVILVCRSGNRSGKVGKLLAEQQGMKNIYHLSHGMKAWINAGKDISKDCVSQLACQ